MGRALGRKPLKAVFSKQQYNSRSFSFSKEKDRNNERISACEYD